MDQSKPFPHFHVRHDFSETMELEMVAGRDFSYEVQTDDSLALIVNETLVRSMQWGTPEEALNKRYYFGGELRGKVIGVVKDYNFVSKHHPIAPLVITLNTFPGAFNLFIKYVAVKVDGNNTEQAIADLEAAWRGVMPTRPFDYFFLDDRLNDSYKAERKLSTVTLIFSGLAIVVACLGLFGLATYSVEQRKKGNRREESPWHLFDANSDAFVQRVCAADWGGLCGGHSARLFAIGCLAQWVCIQGEYCGMAIHLVRCGGFCGSDAHYWFSRI